jgi:hypothetical protein
MGWSKGPQLPDDHFEEPESVGSFGASDELGGEVAGEQQPPPTTRRRVPGLVVLALVLIVISIINALTRGT